MGGVAAPPPADDLQAANHRRKGCSHGDEDPRQNHKGPPDGGLQERGHPQAEVNQNQRCHLEPGIHKGAAAPRGHPAEPGTAALETLATMAAAYASHPNPNPGAPTGCPATAAPAWSSRADTSPPRPWCTSEEANQLEDREAGLLTDQDLEHFQAVYTTPSPASWADTLQILRGLDARLLAEQAGVSRRRLRDILKGTATPHTGLRDRLHAIAASK